MTASNGSSYRLNLKVAFDGGYNDLDTLSMYDGVDKIVKVPLPKRSSFSRSVRASKRCRASIEVAILRRFSH